MPQESFSIIKITTMAIVPNVSVTNATASLRKEVVLAVALTLLPAAPPVHPRIVLAALLTLLIVAPVATVALILLPALTVPPTPLRRFLLHLILTPPLL